MSTKAKRHIHKYQQIRVAGSVVWGCALPDCNHYMPKHMEAMVPGKSSICWSCGKTIVLDERAMSFAHPICNACERMMESGGPTPSEFQPQTVSDLVNLAPVKSETTPEVDKPMMSPAEVMSSDMKVKERCKHCGVGVPITLYGVAAMICNDCWIKGKR